MTGPHEDSNVDALPADLDVTRSVGVYTIPDTRRRLVPAAIYALGAAGSLFAAEIAGNGGLLVAAALLALLGVYHFASAWPRRIDEIEAVAAASRDVGFAIGHASAQLSWRGLRSRPVWRVLIYSSELPPATRGLVQVDAVDGRVIGRYTEDNPEDWSQYGPGHTLD